MDSQNSGIQLITVPNRHSILSTQRSSYHAHRSPSPSAPKKVSTKPTPPSSSVLPARWTMTSITGCLYL